MMLYLQSHTVCSALDPKMYIYVYVFGKPKGLLGLGLQLPESGRMRTSRPASISLTHAVALVLLPRGHPVLRGPEPQRIHKQTGRVWTNSVDFKI